MSFLRTLSLLAFAGLIGVSGCGGGTKEEKLNIGGATVIYPMMDKWSFEYQKAKGVKVNYSSDGSGTTYIWVDYLAKVSPEWKKEVGVSTSVKFPTGVGAKGNEGVSQFVGQNDGAIGYVELIYALGNKIKYGAVKNMEGENVM